MTVPGHPMKGLKGTPEAKKLMEQVRSHKGKGERRSYDQIIEDNLAKQQKRS